MTTWNPADSLNTTTSGGDLTATCNSTAIGNGIRTTTSKSSGKSVIQCTIDMAAGFVDLAMTPAGGGYDDSVAPAVELYYDGGGAQWLCRANPGGFLGIDTTSPAPTGSGDVVQFFLDYAGGVMYFKANGNYLFGGDAGAGTGGIGGGLPTSWFFAAGYAFFGQTAVLDPAPGSLPAGWSAWDAAGAAAKTPFNPWPQAAPVLAT